MNISKKGGRMIIAIMNTIASRLLNSSELNYVIQIIRFKFIIEQIVTSRYASMKNLIKLFQYRYSPIFELVFFTFGNFLYNWIKIIWQMINAKYASVM